MKNNRVLFCIIALVCVIAIGAIAVEPYSTLAGPQKTYTITASCNSGGNITPSGKVVVVEGANKTFNIVPSGRNMIADVKVDGKSVGAVRSYTFKNITKNHTIVVRFMSGGVLPWQQANPYLPW